MRLTPVIAAAVFCLTVCAAWRVGYPRSEAASLLPFLMFIVIARGIWLRKRSATLAIRPVIFTETSPFRRRFTGFWSDAVFTGLEAAILTLVTIHFALQSRPAELALGAALILAVLAVIAILQAHVARQMQPPFVLRGEAWIAMIVAAPMCLAYLILELRFLPPPDYLSAGLLRDVIGAALADLPARRGGLIEPLSVMQTVDAVANYTVSKLQGIPGARLIFVAYSAGICFALARFAAECHAAFKGSEA